MIKYTPIILIIIYTVIVYGSVILLGKLFSHKGGPPPPPPPPTPSKGCYTGCDESTKMAFIKDNLCIPICGKDKKWACTPKCDKNTIYDYDTCECVDCPIVRKCAGECCPDGSVCIANRCVTKCDDKHSLCGLKNCCDNDTEVCKIVNGNFTCVKKSRICKDKNVCQNQDCCGDQCCETIGKYCLDGKCVACKDKDGNSVQCKDGEFCMTDELRKISGSTTYGCVQSPMFTLPVTYNPDDLTICTKDTSSSGGIPAGYAYPDNYCYSTTAGDKPDDFIRIKYTDVGPGYISNLEQCANFMYVKEKTKKVILDKKHCVAYDKCDIPKCSDSVNCPIKDPTKCGPDGEVCDINYTIYDKDKKLCKNTV